MKRTYVIAGLTALGLMAGASAALAFGNKDHRMGEGMRGAPMLNFAEVDADGDGKVTQDEVKAFAKARFDAADKDGNGALSAEEVNAQALERAQAIAARRAEKMAGRMMQRMDANDDGQIGFDEMTGQTDRMGMMFQRLDADGDGAISNEEFANAPMRGEGRHEGRHEGWGHKEHGKGGHDGMRKGQGDCPRN